GVSALLRFGGVGGGHEPARRTRRPSTRPFCNGTAGPHRNLDRGNVGVWVPTEGALRAVARGEEERGMSASRKELDQVRVHIRWMIRRDMPEVLQTEQDSFEYSWTEEDFLRCLRQRNCIGMVAEQGEKVVGFMIYELHKAKLHILNFAVHPASRRA